MVNVFSFIASNSLSPEVVMINGVHLMWIRHNSLALQIFFCSSPLHPCNEIYSRCPFKYWSRFRKSRDNGNPLHKQMLFGQWTDTTSKHHCFYESNVFSVVGMWTHSNVNYKTKQKQNSAVLIKENKTQDIKHQLGCLHPSLTLNGGGREGGRDCIVLAALILRCPSEPRSILSMAWWFIFLREAKGGPLEAIMSSSIHNVDSRDESRISSWWLLLLESLS